MRAAAVGLAGVLSLGGCDPGSTSGDKADARGDHDLALARLIVQREAGGEAAHLTDASFVARNGTIPESNVGHPCTSGRLMELKLIGRFPHIVTTGHPLEPGEHLDFTVTALLVTADAATGVVCRKGVQTGELEPEPGATDIPLG